MPGFCYGLAMLDTDPPLLDAVRRYAGDPGARVLSWDRRGLGNGFADAMAGGDGLILHSGTIRTTGGEREFQLVEKICRVLPPGREPGSWLYWKREAQAYGSGYLGANLSGIRAPDCYGVTYTDDPAARVFIEAIPDPQPDWTLETHARAAEALGMFSAGAMGMPDIEHHDWMAVGRAHSWTAVAADLLNTLADHGSDPILSRWLAGSHLARTADLWRNIGLLRDACAGLAKCFCHHDAFKRNLLFSRNGEVGPEIVAIDWAFAGHGVVGEELAATIGASLMFLEVGPDEAGEMIELAYSGYLNGLRRKGWTGAATDVRLGFCATTAMTFALGALGPWHPLLSDPDQSPVVSGIAGTAPDRFIDNLFEIHRHFLDLGEEAVMLAGG